MSQKYGHCPVPDCERRLIPGKFPHGLCIEHEKWLTFLLFVLPHIKVEQGKTPSGIVLPGSPEFKITPREVKP
jgi:hypothetical protein